MGLPSRPAIAGPVSSLGLVDGLLELVLLRTQLAREAMPHEDIDPRQQLCRGLHIALFQEQADQRQAGAVARLIERPGAFADRQASASRIGSLKIAQRLLGTFQPAQRLPRVVMRP